MLDLTRDEIEGRHCYELIHDSPEPPEFCSYRECVNQEKEVEREFYEPSLERHLRARIFRPSSSGDKKADFYCVHQLQDITEEKKRIEELASYPKHNPHPVMEWNEDRELSFANRAARELLGDGDVDYIDGYKGCLEDQLPEIERTLLERTKDSGSSGEVVDRQLYREFTCKRGRKNLIYGFYFHYLPDRNSIRAYGFDVTERHSAEDSLREVNKDLELLIRVNHLLTRVDEPAELLKRACEAIIEVRDYPLVWVGRKDSGPERKVVPVAQAGFEEGYMDDLEVRWSESELGQGPTGRAIRHNEPRVKERIPSSDDSFYLPWKEKAERHEFSASIALPIPGDGEGEVYGALNIYLQTESTFSDSRVRLLQELANDLGYGLQYIEAQKELREMTIGTLEALSRTVEAKDEYTGEHIDRVESYALELGRSMGLSEERLNQLSYAAELHDVGKVRIPDSILGKPEKLTEQEWVKMEKHPEIGAEILGKVPRLERAAKIVAQHQEKYDGTGYPAGLKGEEITLEARIISVVDAWDAMQTDRPYRDAIPREEAVRELKENAGTQFDPRIVEEFLGLLTGPDRG